MTLDSNRCYSRENNQAPAVYSLNPLNLSFFHLSLRVHTGSLQVGARMKRNEGALVILTLFTDQYPFMLPLLVCLGEVAPEVTLFLPLFSLCFLLSPHHLLFLFFTHLIQRVCTSWEVLAVPLRAALKDWRIQRWESGYLSSCAFLVNFPF